MTENSHETPRPTGPDVGTPGHPVDNPPIANPGRRSEPVGPDGTEAGPEGAEPDPDDYAGAEDH